ncbi:adenylyl-sulfate kinase [Candidatus Pacearchaeota archaeon]|nr:adenylyl-sulfate kinase [Candidatus Pacearchaeota archaeon]
MGVVIWFTGLSGSGKSTIVEALKVKIEKKGKSVEIVDGDAVRKKHSKHLGFSREDLVRLRNRMSAKVNEVIMLIDKADSYCELMEALANNPMMDRILKNRINQKRGRLNE